VHGALFWRAMLTARPWLSLNQTRNIMVHASRIKPGCHRKSPRSPVCAVWTTCPGCRTHDRSASRLTRSIPWRTAREERSQVSPGRRAPVPLFRTATRADTQPLRVRSLLFGPDESGRTRRRNDRTRLTHALPLCWWVRTGLVSRSRNARAVPTVRVAPRYQTSDMTVGSLPNVPSSVTCTYASACWVWQNPSAFSEPVRTHRRTRPHGTNRAGEAEPDCKISLDSNAPQSVPGRLSSTGLTTLGSGHRAVVSRDV
jgi:hypothetical protein